jgi:hypothetical protein
VSNDEKKIETPEEELARLRKDRQDREGARAKDGVVRELEKERLLARFESELGARGSEFQLLDTRLPGDPFVVIKRPAMVQWTKWDQSKQTPTDKYELVAPSVVHPSMEQFNELRQKRVGIESTLSNLMAPMMGIFDAEEAGK